MSEEKTHISRISIGRVYNLGNYEHVRYEITADVSPGCARLTITALERLIEGLRPDRNIASKQDLERETRVIEEARVMPLADFERRHGQPVGGAGAYIARLAVSLQEKIDEREKALKRAERIRELFDDLGGAAIYKDAKLTWDDDGNND